MIKVIFKNRWEDSYDESREYYYQSNSEFATFEIGDIVCVNTKFGYAIAKVIDIDCIDTTVIESDLATVESIIITADEIKDRQEEEERKRRLYNDMARRARTNKRKNELKEYFSDKEDLTNLDKMSDEDIIKLYNYVKMI